MFSKSPIGTLGTSWIMVLEILLIEIMTHLRDILYFFRERHVFPCGIDGIDRFKKRMDLFILCVEVRAYSNDIRLTVLPLPVIHFELSLLECLFDLVSVREINRNRAASIGVVFGRKNDKVPFLGILDDQSSLSDGLFSDLRNTDTVYNF